MLYKAVLEAQGAQHGSLESGMLNVSGREQSASGVNLGSNHHFGGPLDADMLDASGRKLSMSVCKLSTRVDTV